MRTAFWAIVISVLAPVFANAADLNVGTAILKHFLITTDFPNHALWLEARR